MFAIPGREKARPARSAHRKKARPRRPPQRIWLSSTVTYDWTGQNRLRRVRKGLLVLGPRVSSLFLSAAGFLVLFVAFWCSFYLPHAGQGSGLRGIVALDVVAHVLMDATFLLAISSMLVAGLTDPGIIPPLGLDRCLVQAGDKYSLIRSRLVCLGLAGRSPLAQQAQAGAPGDQGDQGDQGFPGTPAASPQPADEAAQALSEDFGGIEFGDAWGQEGSSWGAEGSADGGGEDARYGTSSASGASGAASGAAGAARAADPPKKAMALLTTVGIAAPGGAAGRRDSWDGSESAAPPGDASAAPRVDLASVDNTPAPLVEESAWSTSTGASGAVGAEGVENAGASRSLRPSNSLEALGGWEAGAQRPELPPDGQHSQEALALGLTRPARELPVVAGSKYLKAGQASVSVRKCPTCFIFRPLRSHHCSVSDCCFYRFDHYCAWLGTAVAYRNHGWFFLLLASATLFLLFLACFSLIALAVGFYGLWAYYTGPRESPFPVGWFAAAALVRIALAAGGIFLLFNLASLLAAHLGYLRQGLTTKEMARVHKGGGTYSEEEERLAKLTSSFNRGGVWANLRVAFQGFCAPSLMGLALWRASQTAAGIESESFWRGADAGAAGETLESPDFCSAELKQGASQLSIKPGTKPSASPSPGGVAVASAESGAPAASPRAAAQRDALLRAWEQLQRGWTLDSRELTELFKAQSDSVNEVLRGRPSGRRRGKRASSGSKSPRPATLTTPSSASAAVPHVFTRRGMRSYALEDLLLTAKAIDAFAVWASTAQVKEVPE